jgi:hypothetical protein
LFRLEKTGISSPGGDTSLFVALPFEPVFVGDSVSLRFHLYNHDSATTAVLHALPNLRDGEWRNGAITFSSGSAVPHREAKARAAIGLPFVVEPGSELRGAICLDDFFDFPGPGKIACQFAFEVDCGSTEPRRLLSNRVEFEILPDPAKAERRQGAAIKAVAAALTWYCIDNSRYPEPRNDAGRPALPANLTTPIAYVGSDVAGDAEELAVFCNPYFGGISYLVAGKGPDKDWDIGIMFDSDRAYTEQEVLPFAYDPTNGARSSGDLMVLSTQAGDHSRQSESFRVWGNNGGKGGLLERTRRDTGTAVVR